MSIEKYEGLIASVRMENKAYFIDTNGVEIELGSYLFTDNFSSGWACVNKGGTRIQNPKGVVGGNFFFIDIEGKFLPLRFEGPSFFSEGLAVVDQGQSWRIVNNEGKVIGKSFQRLFPFKNGLAAALNFDTLGYVNTMGEWEFLMKPGDILHAFSDGIAKVERNQKTGFINPSGQWLIEPTNRKIFDFKERKAVFEEKGLYGVVNDEGNLVIPCKYSDLTDYSEDRIGFKMNGKWGFMNEEGKVVISPQFEEVRKFSESLVSVQKEGKVGVIDLEGRTVIPFVFDAVYEFKNGLAIAQNEQKLGYIDLKGDWVIAPQFDRANLFVDPNLDNDYYRVN